MDRVEIAIVGMACVYPDAHSPAELWENVMAQRRAFRRMPDVRMNLADYHSPDRAAPDKTYSTEAAVLTDYEFDRLHFKVSGRTWRTTDLTHWLALDVASRALVDAGLAGEAALPTETTGVFLGNTLTGEFSRAGLMRYRWPYVRRTVEAALLESGWSAGQRSAWLDALEERYKAPFAPVGEDSLAGGLANTIAGRICNYFDFKGGGYTVDGACSSSLLATTHACSALAAGDLDVALAGGVDLSLDPFELLGFAKTGALAEVEMRVFEERSAGFWPGEGCGIVVLMRAEEARRRGLRIYATVRGWGISSDGQGGITRPEVGGQLLAIRRAYRRAGFGVDTVTYFEGHGTGTAVGDATELKALSAARREVNAAAPRAWLGSIKALMGHCKAAAGIGGLLKAALVLHHRVIPPTAGCERPHAELTAPDAALQIAREGLDWPEGSALRAGVSSMGFGGINTHIVLEGAGPAAPRRLGPAERRLLSSAQDAEVFLFCAPTPARLREQIGQIAEWAAQLSRAELGDLASELVRHLGRGGAYRAALVASTPAQLAARLGRLLEWLHEGVVERADDDGEVWLGGPTSPRRVGLLFPGQAAPVYQDGGSWKRRFSALAELWGGLRPGDELATDVAQPTILRAEVAGIRLLRELGVEGVVAVGHSLGELAALHWAGSLGEETLLELGAERGRLMAAQGEEGTTMASLDAAPGRVQALLQGLEVVIACYNGPEKTVVSGKAEAVEQALACGRAQGVHGVRLPVTRAFHSPWIRQAADGFGPALRAAAPHPPSRRVVSTVTGEEVEPSADLVSLLSEQIAAPVQFTQAMERASSLADLWIEVGPGHILRGLSAARVVSMDAGGPSLRGLLRVAGALYGAGALPRPQALFEDRFTRPISLSWAGHFLENPCEAAPLVPKGAEPEEGRRAQASGPVAAPEPSPVGSAPRDVAVAVPSVGLTPPRPTSAPAAGGQPAAGPTAGEGAAARPLDVVRAIVAQRSELPVESVGPRDRMLSDLHLNSLTVSQIVAQASRELGIDAPSAGTSFANATLEELAAALEGAVGHPGRSKEGSFVAGLGSWVRPFEIRWREMPRPALPPSSPGEWELLAPEVHPLVAPLRLALRQVGGRGVVVLLPPEPRPEMVGLMLDGARRALTRPGQRFVLVTQAPVGGGLARTLHLEDKKIPTAVIHLPYDAPEAASWIAAEVATLSGFKEVRLTAGGGRSERELVLMEAPSRRAAPLGPEDVVLVTGGGKGITAECALALARRYGARLALVGRTSPEVDKGLAANLERMAASGAQLRYYAVDITHEVAVADLLRRIEADLGAVTGLVHGAARNEPRGLVNLSERDFLATLEPKALAAQRLLDALNPERLRLVVGLSSIIGVAGLWGEADYSVANEWLSWAVERWQQAHPHCLCLSIEWSVWAGVGMGERLGQLDALLREGITPIQLDDGLALLLELLEARAGDPARVPVSVVAAGRSGDLPTLRLARPELPFLRFVDQVKVFVPGVELIVEAELTPRTDPYLADHRFRGDCLFPAVMGMEAMAQVARALTGASALPHFEGMVFQRPIVASGPKPTRIRILAQQVGEGRVEVAIRTSEAGYSVDAFRGTCAFGEAPPSPRAEALKAIEAARALPPVAFDAEEFYRAFLFHEGRFRRIRSYQLLRARECVFELNSSGGGGWFDRVLPPQLLLGDPGRRDATIHGLQACIPQTPLLPVRLGRLTVVLPDVAGPVWVHARETAHQGAVYTWEIEVLTPDGALVERWEGLQMQAVAGADFTGRWPEAFLGTWLERAVVAHVPGVDVAVVAERQKEQPTGARGEGLASRALGRSTRLRKRGDGKPEVEGAHVCLSHAGPLSMVVASPQVVACDIEWVGPPKGAGWGEVLGAPRMELARQLTRLGQEAEDVAATRVWGAAECLVKAGAPMDAPISLLEQGSDGWTILASGDRRILTRAVEVSGSEAPLMVALLASGGAHGR